MHFGGMNYRGMALARLGLAPFTIAIIVLFQFCIPSLMYMWNIIITGVTMFVIVMLSLPGFVVYKLATSIHGREKARRDKKQKKLESRRR